MSVRLCRCALKNKIETRKSEAEQAAREEGFDEIADWFETLAKAEKSHAGKFQKTLESIG